jgi:hypothetical protein
VIHDRLGDAVLLLVGKRPSHAADARQALPEPQLYCELQGLAPAPHGRGDRTTNEQGSMESCKGRAGGSGSGPCRLHPGKAAPLLDYLGKYRLQLAEPASILWTHESPQRFQTSCQSQSSRYRGYTVRGIDYHCRSKFLWKKSNSFRTYSFVSVVNLVVLSWPQRYA